MGSDLCHSLLGHDQSVVCRSFSTFGLGSMLKQDSVCTEDQIRGSAINSWSILSKGKMPFASLPMIHLLQLSSLHRTVYVRVHCQMVWECVNVLGGTGTGYDKVAQLPPLLSAKLRDERVAKWAQMTAGNFDEA